MTKYLPFVLDSKKYFTNQKAFIITGEHLGSLIAFCNSSLFKFVYSDNFPELQGGTRELSKVFFERLVVKKEDDKIEKEYMDLITHIQLYKSMKKDSKLLEQELDSKILNNYRLNPSEIKAVHDSLNL